MDPSHKITVIGGGIAGITAAHELARVGHEVTLVEAGERLGGLGTYFDWNGQPIDKFYHCQMPSDDDLLQLIDDLGITGDMYWKKTRMGFLVDGKRYAFNGALDLLKFKPLTFFERIRFGVVSLLLRPLGKGKDLDNMRIEDWLSDIYGKSIWNKLLKPLFVSKFGPAAGDMPALYIWARLGREKNTASRGYLKGGLKHFLDTAEAKLKEMGVDIIKSGTVASLDQLEDQMVVTLKDQSKLISDYTISTLPLPLLKKILIGTALEENVRIPDVPYQGVVNAMFFLKRPLDNYYWAPVMGCGTDFDGIVEMTELIDTEHYSGHHCAYVMKYCDRESELFQEDDATIAHRWKKQLIDLYPDLQLTTADIAEVKVFKAPFVEPAYPLGYSELKPAINENGNRLFLATSSQVYPRITAWNSSCWMAKQVVRELRFQIAKNPRKTGVIAESSTIQ